MGEGARQKSRRKAETDEVLGPGQRSDQGAAEVNHGSANLHGAGGISALWRSGFRHVAAAQTRE